MRENYEIDGLNFKTKPWPHQLAALKFFMPRYYGALYTEPGTGKSKVFIDLIENRGFECIIIVGTKKPLETWEKQFKLHAREPADVIQLLGINGKQQAKIIKKLCQRRREGTHSGRVVILITYSSIWRKPLGDLLADKLFADCVICDESHKIKSPGSKCSRYLAKLGRRTANRFLLTGTPLAERIEDAYAQYRFMKPSIFGTRFADFCAEYQNIDARATSYAGYPILNKDQPYKNMDQFKEKFWEPAFKIPSSVKLPKRKNIVYKFELGKKGARAYTLISKHGAIDTRQGELLVENVLSQIIRRQQATSGFIPLKDDLDETKLYNTDTARMEALAEILEELSKDEPVVIFARFVKDLKNIRKVCSQLNRGYSEISGKEDTERDWQRGRTSVIGVQYASGSESVDLTRARYCIYYSMTHSLIQYGQSKKRIHRPGQDRMCVYYHLESLCYGKETIDGKMIQALKRKQNIVNEVERGNIRI